MHLDLAWQPSLFSAPADPSEQRVDPSFAALRRHRLDERSWVEVAPGWLREPDELFTRLLSGTPWSGHRVRMYERTLDEPRLTYRWQPPERPPEPVLEEMAELLSARYGVRFTQVGANLYRDGADSVAWHGDRVARELPRAVVALVSLGAARPFRLRPTGGGESVTFRPGPGDLLVMGGACQRDWQHCVPKVAAAAPRISVQFRHAYPTTRRPGVTTGAGPGADHSVKRSGEAASARG